MAQLRIFVSHSSHDNAWCRPFADALKAVGYDVWYDETGLQGGAAWVDSIQREVENRDVFLLVLTPEAWESKWVQDELQLAIATRRRILPVLLRNTQVSGFLLTTQWITVIGEEPQAAARAAIKAIEAPPAPGRNAAPQTAGETLDDLKVLCRSLATEGRYTEALSACERALALDRNNIEVLRIKAWVLDKIGEHRLEGQTLFQILVLDPSNEYLWPSELGITYPYMRICDALNDEHDLLQACSLFVSAIADGRALSAYALKQSLSKLGKINHLDAAMDSVARLDNDHLRKDVCFILEETGRTDLVARLLEGWYGHVQYSYGADGMFVYEMLELFKRSDLAIRLLEEWYGYPPRLSTVADIPMLASYAYTLTNVGRRDDARDIYKLIVRIFEDVYSQALAWRPFRDPASHPWRSSSEREAFKVYLDALDVLGRAQDANRLMKTYPNVNTKANT